MKPRANDGKFASTTAPAPPKAFDLVADLQGMFTKAVSSGDIAGAATVGRILRDFVDASGAAPTSTSNSDYLAFLTADEHNELTALARRSRELRSAAIARKEAPIKYLGTDGVWRDGTRPKPAPRAAAPAATKLEAQPTPAAKPYRLDRSLWAQAGLTALDDGSPSHALGPLVAEQIASGELPFNEVARHKAARDANK